MDQSRSSQHLGLISHFRHLSALSNSFLSARLARSRFLGFAVKQDSGRCKLILFWGAHRSPNKRPVKPHLLSSTDGCHASREGKTMKSKIVIDACQSSPSKSERNTSKRCTCLLCFWRCGPRICFRQPPPFCKQKLLNKSRGSRKFSLAARFVSHFPVKFPIFTLQVAFKDYTPIAFILTLFDLSSDNWGMRLKCVKELQSGKY